MKVNNKLSEPDLDRLAIEFEDRPVEELLEWAVGEFSPSLVMTSNFGADGVVLIDKLMDIAPNTPVIYLDTGFQFGETDSIKEKMVARYGLNLVERRADLSVSEQSLKFGERLYQSNPDLCCNIRKVEPLRKALLGYDGWIVALRRDQSPTRANIRKIEWNAKHSLVKINPLADWTRKEVWDYIVSEGLPYNKLYDEGYTSIGCAPCTRRVAPGSHERSGRWDGERKLECGIHAV